MSAVEVRPGPTQTTREDAELERLFAQYSGRLLAYCARRSGSRSEAEDAVQLTFLYALRALRRGVVPESESAWLHAIAANVCRSQYRTASRRGVSSDVGVESLASPTPDPDETELLAGVRDALQSLPLRQRRALVLREWHGLAPREIATHLGMSTPATHALLTRARRSFAVALTASGRQALALASLVYELRTHIKALAGGASAKAAVATIAVVGVGAGGVVAERSLGQNPASPPGTVSAVDQAAANPASTTSAEPVAVRPSAVEEGGLTGALQSGSSAIGVRTPVAGPTAPELPFVPATSPDADEQGPGPVGQPDAPSPSPESPAAVSVDHPPLPSVEPPTELLPPVELPPVDLPPIDVPPVDLPPVELPPVSGLPEVDLPPVDLPPVDVPPLELPPIPPLPLPLP